jgi:hypothetical protein
MLMRRWCIVLLVIAVPQFAFAWGARVHRMLTDLALDGLPADAPAWLRDAATRERVAFQANQPDRWRGSESLVLKHENDPEHYLDVEDLAPFGLTLETMPPLRREYVRALAIAKHMHPESAPEYDAAKDPARAREWPGFLPYAIADHYAKLQAAFQQVRILEQTNDPRRKEQLEQARAIVVYHLGTLSHFVADVAQPLHTTKHYNGWVGENPQNYKWRDRFHSYIDEGVVDRHKIDKDVLRATVKHDQRVRSEDPWEDVLKYLQRSHAQMEPLYRLETARQLDGLEGRELIIGQLSDAASMLAAIVSAAWESSAPTPKQAEQWLRYDDTEKASTQPATRPSTSSAQ